MIEKHRTKQTTEILDDTEAEDNFDTAILFQ
jgi:hypothetical protein